MHGVYTSHNHSCGPIQFSYPIKHTLLCSPRGPLSMSILGYGFVKEDAVAWVFRSKTSRYGSLNSQVMAAGDGRVKLPASLA